MICDGVGTHIGFSVLEVAVQKGMEEALRVPHLSFRLQGEDTVNFGVLKVNCWERNNKTHIATHRYSLVCPAAYITSAMEAPETEEVEGDQSG